MPLPESALFLQQKTYHAVSLSRMKHVDTLAAAAPSPQQVPKGMDLVHATSVIAALSSPYSSATNLSIAAAATGSLLSRVSPSTVLCLQSHPAEPFYLSGGNDGGINLWQFGGGDSPVYVYRGPTSSDAVRVHGIRFNAMGTKFAACDHSGKVSMWRWDDEPSSLVPYWTVQCHSGRTNDLAFLNHGSYFVTAGHSSSTTRKNVKFWDTLLPLTKANVWSVDALENGASCVVYSSKHQRAFVGDKGGYLCAIDVRQQRVAETIEKAHESNISSLALDPSESILFSACADGSVKLWDVDACNYQYNHGLKSFQDWSELHKTSSIIRPLAGTPLSLMGAVELRVTRDFVYSCGADGRVVRREMFY
jgi:WD40 repeat protein